jgi:hypothetical protein
LKILIKRRGNMKQIAKRLVSIFIFTLLTSILFLSTIVVEVAATEDHYIEGIIKDTNGNPLGNIDVFIIDLDSTDEIETSTDNNGNYGICFEDNEWYPPLSIKITIDEAVYEKAQFITMKIIEGITENIGNLIIDTAAFEIPEDPDMLPNDPWLGSVLCERTSSGGSQSSYDPNNAEYFGRLGLTDQCSVNFDIRYKDPRNLITTDYRERYKIVSDQYSAGSWSDNDNYEEFNAPYDTGTEQIGLIVDNPNGLRGTFEKFQSYAGYDVQEYDDYQEKWIFAPGGGTGGTDHYIYLTRL